MLQRWILRQGWGLWIGIGLTLVTVMLHLAGLTERIELLGFDYHVRHFSRIPASDRIVHIDIDDDALARLESWPWPRDIQGELIRILHELGAERMIMDIVWSEPKGAEVRMPALGRYADVEGELEQIGELSPENVIFPDDELAAAISDAKQVYLSMYYSDSATQAVPSLTKRIAELLRKDFGLSAAAIRDQLSVELTSVEDILAGVKHNVAEELVQKELDATPLASAAQVHAAILKTPFDRETADRADLLSAYHRQLGMQALREKCPPVPAGLKGKLPTIERMTPPVYKFTAGARKAGFVTFKPDFDGCTRHIPLLLDWDGLLVEQLAFGVARDLLNIQVDDLSIDHRGNLLISARENRPAMRVQLDEQGQLINWHVEPRGWQDCFTHVPVTKLLEVYDCRKRMRENEIRKQLAIARAIRLAKDDTAYEGYREQVNTLLQKERSVRWARLQRRGDTDSVRAADAEAKQLRQQVETDQNQTIQFISEQWTALKSEPNPNDPEIAQDYKRFEEAHRLIDKDVGELVKVNEQIAAQERYALDRLRPMIQNKVCFVGYTATAVADMVTTPAYSRMPGVLVHSNVLNSFLQGQFRTWSPKWFQAGVIALFGICISVLTATRPPKFTAFLVLLIFTVSLLLNALGLFARMDHWERLLTALIITFFVWAIIVLFRYFTTERQKRQFSKAVAQYVSPAVAKRIADSTTRLDLSPVNRVVTCFFSDLAGFTRMSERLGPEGTRAVLNPYLEAMSNVLHQHHALINKFIGDGIFAFFNPPILPCDGHQLAACEAALDSQQALDELVAKYADDPAAADFRQLYMRVGIASGAVFVGDYGSENKLDYTCMGDTVNLASRLEGANKVFGTKILLAGSTHDPVAGKYVSRRLGRLQVKGQTIAVPIWELVGRIGEVNGDELSFVETFGTAVEAFARRDWHQATSRFERCLKQRPRELAARRYIELIEGYQKNPPPQSWNCAIELSEK